MLAQGILPFKIQGMKPKLDVTAYAGLPTVIEALRAILPREYYVELSRALKGTYGHEVEWKTVRRHFESLVVLIAAGGDCIDDLQRLRKDRGLRRLLGFELSSPTRVKEFLYAFHQGADGRPITPQEDACLSRQGEAQIREEGPGLRVLCKFLQRVVHRLQGLRRQEQATLDIDATIVAAAKETALKAYEGTVGYQPQMAWWHEHKVWVRDQFRDGNVPAEFRCRDFLESVVKSLPAGVKKVYVRGDSALYNEEALTWAVEHGVFFVVSADMSQSLFEVIEAVPEKEWQEYHSKEGDDGPGAKEERQCVEVCFVPDWGMNRKKDGIPLRYIAIRVRSRQGSLLESTGAEPWRHFAVVTNIMDWASDRVLRWHRQKQGTVEHGHLVMKDELAGGTLPCGRFGSNAAWWRINAIVHNLLTFLKAVALPPSMAALRPKGLRFRLFNIGARVIQHARQTILCLCETDPVFKILVKARAALAALCFPRGAVPAS